MQGTTKNIDERKSASRCAAERGNLMAELSGNGHIRGTLLTAFWAFVDSYGYEKARMLVRRFHPALPSSLPATASLRAVVGRVGATI
jgi:hypothetical protein